MRAEEAQARENGAMTQEPGRNLGDGARGAEAGAAATEQTKAEGPSLMEAVVERSNLWLAYERVVQNRGAPGVDGLTVEQFKDWLKMHWPSVKAASLDGRYVPAAVRAVAPVRSASRRTSAVRPRGRTCTNPREKYTRENV